MFVPAINIMLYIPKIEDYLKILTDKEVKDFVVKIFNETVRKQENLKKVVKSLYISLTTPDNCLHHYDIEILNLFDPKL